MTADLELATRVRAILSGYPDITEQAMFGGLCFLRAGKMACGVMADRMMVRVGPEAHAAALAEPHVRVMDFTGRPLSGFVVVDRPGIKTRAALTTWIERGLAYAAVAATRPTSKARPPIKRTDTPKPPLTPPPKRPATSRPVMTRPGTPRPRAR